jgi:hypothetical protein
MTPVARMKPFERRRLSGAEIALGQTLFAAEINWPRVRVAQAPALGFAAMVPVGGVIVFGRWRAARDFSGVELAEQGWFIHELAHVWQAARGVVLATAKLAALGAGAYRYAPCADARLKLYNIESQAEIVRHLFLARAGAGAPDAPPRQWLEEIWARR